jgi:hypothetical protein
MKWLLVCMLVASALGVQVAFKAGSNVTVSDNDKFKFRKTALLSWDLGGLTGGLLATSLAIDGSGQSLTVDIIQGAGYTALFAPPTVWLGYFHAAADWTKSDDYSKASVAKAAGFMGSVYLSLQEKVGAEVKQKIPLNELVWDLGSVTEGDLSFGTWVGKKGVNPGTFKVELTLIKSSILGVLDDSAGGAALTPRSLETIITVTDFPYQDAASGVVVLNIAVGSGKVEANVDVDRQLKSGTGDDAVYFYASSKVVVDGTVKDGTVSAFANGDVEKSFENENFKAQIKEKFQGDATVQLVSIASPTAGAKSVVFDPTLGQGPFAAASRLSVAFMVLAVGLALLF